MRAYLQLLCVVALGLILAPAILVFLGVLDGVWLKRFMLAGTVLWFLAAIPLDKSRDAPEANT